MKLATDFLDEARPADYQHALGTLGYFPADEERDDDPDRIVVRNADGAFVAAGRVVTLDWDSRFFGVGAGRLEGLFLGDAPDASNQLVAALTEKSANRGIGFLTCRIRGDEPSLVRALEDTGFRLCDAMTYYTTELMVAKNPATPVDRQRADAIVRRCLAGLDMGRVFEDPKIDKDKARRFHAEASRHYLDSGAHVTILEDRGRDVGFAIGIDNEAVTRQSGRRYGHLWLIAVDPELRGRGFGERLFNAFLREFAPRCDVLEIGTQTDNVAANRLYRGAGCRELGQVLTFHRWSEARR